VKEARLYIRVTRERKEQLEQDAKNEGISLSELLLKAYDEKIKNRNQEG
jgi:hypothetical protein